MGLMVTCSRDSTQQEAVMPCSASRRQKVAGSGRHHILLTVKKARILPTHIELLAKCFTSPLNPRSPLFWVLCCHPPKGCPATRLTLFCPLSVGARPGWGGVGGEPHPRCTSPFSCIPKGLVYLTLEPLEPHGCVLKQSRWMMSSFPPIPTHRKGNSHC